MPQAIAAAVTYVGASAATAAVVAEVASNVLIGAAIGAAGAAITGGDIGKGALLGGITAGIASGIDVAVNGVSATAANAANSAAGLEAGAEGAAVAGQSGALFGSAAESGASAAATGSGVTAAETGKHVTDFSDSTSGLLSKGPTVDPTLSNAQNVAAPASTTSGGINLSELLKHDAEQRALDRAAARSDMKTQILAGGASDAVKGLLAPDPIAQIEADRNLQLRNDQANKISITGPGTTASASVKFTEDPAWLQQFNGGLLSKKA